ncbi:RDD family protein [Streptomyces sp. NPDC001978]|uniref:RDD family protein n=1 Tax=Streptomyces sp. NPDC001978 TaxID=3364627 RepID=UPI0036B6CC67
MSAPTPAPGDDMPRAGYYPDPSIPGYVRYWNGAAWVPGTSRPAPHDAEPLTQPPGAPPAAPAVEETGPHFFDEDPQPAPSGSEPASAWGADRAQQSGFGGEQDRRVSWGADPRIPADLPSQPDGRSPHTDGSATIPPADPADVASGGTFVFRRPAAGSTAPTDEGTMTFRAVPPGASGSTPAAEQGGPAARFGGQGAAGAGMAAGGSDVSGSGAPSGISGAGFGVQGPVGAGGQAGARPGFGAGKAAAERAAAQAEGPGAAGAQAPPAAQAGAPQPSSAAQVPAAHASFPHQAAPASQAASPAQGAAAPQAPSVPQQATPVTSGPGGGQSSWAQQVHQLAGAGGGEQPVAPWKPPVEDVFQAAARRQAEARPAGLGKRLAARLIDSVLVGAVTGAAAVPLVTKAADHVQEKIDAAKLSGRTVTVWLLDGTTGAYLGIVLAVLLLTGLLYEVLPTAKWGRTLGKKLCGLQVRDIEGHEPPAFGLSLRRWLVYTVPGLLGIGVVGVAWCLFDRPWHQCWHDKAAHTFVAEQ